MATILTLAHLREANYALNFDEPTLELMKAAADGGEVEEQCNYAICCLYGIGEVSGKDKVEPGFKPLQRDLVLAEHYAKLAMENGSTEALYNIGLAYLTGEDNISTNIEKATDFILMGLEGAKRKFNITNAVINLAFSLIEGRNGLKKEEKKGFRLLQLAYINGNIDAAVALANCYEWGTIIDKDLKKAETFYRFAAIRGSYDAQYRLSRFFREGLIGYPKDIHMAERLLEAASFGTSRLSDKAKTLIKGSKRLVNHKLNNQYSAENPYGGGPFSSEQEELAVKKGVSLREPIALNWVGNNLVQSAFNEWYDSEGTQDLDLKKIQEGMVFLEYSALLGNLSSLYSLAQHLRRYHGRKSNVHWACELLEVAASRGHLEAAKSANEIRMLYRIIEDEFNRHNKIVPHGEVKFHKDKVTDLSNHRLEMMNLDIDQLRAKKEAIESRQQKAALQRNRNNQENRAPEGIKINFEISHEPISLQKSSLSSHKKPAVKRPASASLIRNLSTYITLNLKQQSKPQLKPQPEIIFQLQTDESDKNKKARLF